MARSGALLGAAALTTGLSLASAAGATGVDTGCPAQAESQAFLAWGDPAEYVLAAGGDFGDASAWTLGGGAAVVAGSDGFALGGAAPTSASLALPDGATATGPASCVSLQDPTVRFVTRNTGASTSTLRVSATVTGALGSQTLPVGTISAGSNWAPSPVLPLLASLTAPLSGGTTSVSLSFAPQGAGGGWQVADVHIDPWSLGG